MIVDIPDAVNLGLSPMLALLENRQTYLLLSVLDLVTKNRVVLVLNFVFLAHLRAKDVVGILNRLDAVKLQNFPLLNFSLQVLVYFMTLVFE